VLFSPPLCFTYGERCFPFIRPFPDLPLKDHISSFWIASFWPATAWPSIFYALLGQNHFSLWRKPDISCNTFLFFFFSKGSSLEISLQLLILPPPYLLGLKGRRVSLFTSSFFFPPLFFSFLSGVDSFCFTVPADRILERSPSYPPSLFFWTCFEEPCIRLL